MSHCSYERSCHRPMSLSVELPTTWRPSCARPTGGITRSHRVSELSWKFDCRANWISLLFQSLFSRGAISCLGRSVVHCGAKSTIRIQRESFHINGHLQRVSPHLLPQRFDVSRLSYLHVYTSFVGFIFYFSPFFPGCTMKIHKNCCHYFSCGLAVVEGVARYRDAF